ncbi:MAG: type II toxin-antitoxin system PemK/MazF family toxin, partial [Planctomycetes bacterium]|nr:type II toxin-antitoxin system PemK/MazF family toxin [Planctomycetota bacterium]
TDWKDRYAVAPWMVRLEAEAGNGLDKTSAADAFQVRSVAQQRFVRQLGKLSVTAMQEISRALAVVLSLET